MGGLPALPEDIRLGWQRQTVANTLAYHDTTENTEVKSFIVQAPRTNPIKLFAVVIYGFL
jgi:hypothetical protein